MAREERDLIVRLLTTLLREDVAGLRTRGRLIRAGRSGPGRARPDRPRAMDGEQWLVHHRLRLPVRLADVAHGDLVSDLAVREPVVLRTTPRGRVRVRRLHSVLNVVIAELIRGLDPEPAAELAAGFLALRREAVAALAGARLRRRHRPSVFGRLRADLAGRSGLGWPGAIGFESLAAHRDHPLYPFSLARVGLPVAQLPRLAPEHLPDLGLRWLMLPAAALEQHGRRPDWWPPATGSNGEEQSVAFPVHPAVPLDVLRQALTEVGVDPARADGSAERLLSGGFTLRFRPTLSLRTLVAVREPAVHVKLPLPVRTLGRLNLRTITRRGLADGALVGVLLRSVLRVEPEWQDDVRVADESCWLHAGHPLLAVLVRRWDTDPDGQSLDAAMIVPVAGLAGIGPDGRPVIVMLADRFADGDLDRLLTRYLRLVIGFHAGLWLRYGIALEAHSQNVLIAVDRTASGPRIRLLLRDVDSAKLDLEYLAERLGTSAPTLADLGDKRLAASHPNELADLFVTTTLHQCVAAVLIDVARSLGRPARPWLDLVKPLLAEVTARHPDSKGAFLLRTGIIEGTRLPVKRALTAATLLPKIRTGAADVNKYYGADAPSYL